MREIEEIKQIWLGCGAARKRRARADETVFDKLYDCSVVHGYVGDVMLPHEGRDHNVRHAESKLRGKTLLRGRIACAGTGINGRKIAVQSGRSAGRKTGLEAIRVDCNRLDIRDRPQRSVCIIVRVTGNRRHVIERPTGLVVAQEEHRACPRWTLHEGIDDWRNLLLTR